MLPVNGRQIEFEVSRVDDRSLRGVEGDAETIRNAVVRAEEANLHVAEGQLAARVDLMQSGGAEQPVLPELALNKPQGQPRRVDRQVQLLDDEGDAADVVLVAVGDDQRFDAVPILEQESDVGNDDVDAQKAFVGKFGTAVDDEDVVVILHDVHVFADFVDAAEGDDRKLVRCPFHVLETPFAGGLAGSVHAWKS